MHNSYAESVRARLALLRELEDCINNSVGCADLRDFAIDAKATLKAFIAIRMDAMGAKPLGAK